AAFMREAIAELETRLAAAREAGGEAARARHRDRGKLLPRERLERLLDDSAAFLELSPLAAWEMYDNESPGASVITGIGAVGGRQCAIVAHEATVKGGAIYPVSVQKVLRLQEIARRNRLPCVYLVESAGANLRYQSEFFADLGSRTFANQTRMSAAGIPQIAVVFGNATAGGAYVPGLSDYTIFVRGQAKVFLAGPPLVKAATGEETDDETLGGAAMHASKSGLADYVADDDAGAIERARTIVATLERSATASEQRLAPVGPAYDVEELLGIVPRDRRRLFDMREVVARIVDDSRFLEFKANFGTSLVAGHAHLDGWPIGVLANNNVLFSDSAQKAAQFVQLCEQSATPLLYLQNITGFMVGTSVEQGGIVKHGSALINAVANATVPQFTVIVGASYGAGNYGMCGRGLDPALLLTWPSSRIAVMGPQQAAGVLSMVSGKASDAMRAEIEAQFERESTPYYATARLWDDGIVDPRATRRALAHALVIARRRDDRPANTYGAFRL
ncbi:MAG: methylcrotonoyl-CoA carboxylase, partial [Candidatus Eremiobacteraeota bacterium]|nr:methylcrotonoyl-CoA carboxylase [Candidatus Eremiobacteraeota bacterium]